MTIFIDPTYHDKYVAYTLSNVDDQIIYANVEHYSQLFNIPTQYHDEFLNVTIIMYHSNRLTLYNKFKSWCKTNHVKLDVGVEDLIKQDKRVVQLSSGKIFTNPTQCAKELSISYDALIKHLKGMPYYRSVKGEEYSYIGRTNNI